jgi:hypothetical protein
LILKFASKAIPSFVERLMHLIYKYFSKSPNRSATWRALQKDLAVKELAIKKNIDIRWLNQEDCISRLLEIE